MRRSIIIFIIVLLAVLIVGFGAYLRLRDGTTAPPDNIGDLPPPGDLPPGNDDNLLPGEGNLPPAVVEPAVRGAALDYFVRPSGETVFIQPGGEIISASSTSIVVSDTKVAGILEAQFSATGNYVLVKYGSAKDPDWSIYDLKKKEWRQLGIQAFEADWAPNADRIAYVAVRPASSLLTTLDVNTTTFRPRVIATLSATDLVAKWAGASRILIMERSAAPVPGTVWTYDLKKSSLFLLYENLRGADIAWGTADRGLLMRASNVPSGAELFLIDGDGRQVRTLSFLTLPGKCAFRNSDKMFCGIPKDTEDLRKRTLPDDYRQREFFTADAVYEIDLTSGVVREVANEINADFDMTKVKIFGNALYFINRVDGLLYKIDLPQANAV